MILIEFDLYFAFTCICSIILPLFHPNLIDLIVDKQ